MSNNPLLEHDLTAERADAIGAMEAAYAAAGITHFAAWMHEADEAMRSDLERRGYTFAAVTGHASPAAMATCHGFCQVST